SEDQAAGPPAVDAPGSARVVGALVPGPRPAPAPAEPDRAPARPGRRAPAAPRGPDPGGGAQREPRGWPRRPLPGAARHGAGGQARLTGGGLGVGQLASLAPGAAPTGPLEIQLAHGQSGRGSALEPLLREAGFSTTPRGLVLWPEREPALPR